MLLNFQQAQFSRLVHQISKKVAWERDKWQPDKRWNEIYAKSGLKTGGFIQRDTWEPSKRWNVYDSDGQYKGKLQQDTLAELERYLILHARRSDKIEELVTAMGLIEMFKNADIHCLRDMLG